MPSPSPSSPSQSRSLSSIGNKLLEVTFQIVTLEKESWDGLEEAMQAQLANQHSICCTSFIETFSIEEVVTRHPPDDINIHDLDARD
uniref:Uncharacterized protein n=1 Tax=Tanacetum cinerariifolium TaxID=118510 RepID=A0A6L2N8W2_TANCI|nr:hypothetical protein [Tanacetum cinerariifolium]